MIPSRKDEAENQLLKRIGTALEKARDAVSADKTGDYETAVSSYKATVQLLQLETDNLPIENRTSLADKIKKYQNRIDSLERSIPTLSKEVTAAPEPSREAALFPEVSPPDNMALPAIPVELVLPTLRMVPHVSFEEVSEVYDKEKEGEVPFKDSYKPYWLITKILKTIQTGGYITPNLYVPKSVWILEGAKFPSVEAKVTACVQIVYCLKTLDGVKVEDSLEVEKNLEAVLATLDSVRMDLSKGLTYISANGKGAEKKGLFSSLASGVNKTMTKLAEKAKEDDAYIGMLVEALQCALKLNSWLEYYDKEGGNCVGLLMRCSEFFSNVLLMFALKDLAILLANYASYCSQSFLQCSP